jgi:hypothetical protein
MRYIISRTHKGFCNLMPQLLVPMTCKVHFHKSTPECGLGYRRDEGCLTEILAGLQALMRLSCSPMYWEYTTVGGYIGMVASHKNTKRWFRELAKADLISNLIASISEWEPQDTCTFCFFQGAGCRGTAGVILKHVAVTRWPDREGGGSILQCHGPNSTYKNNCNFSALPDARRIKQKMKRMRAVWGKITQVKGFRKRCKNFSLPKKMHLFLNARMGHFLCDHLQMHNISTYTHIPHFPTLPGEWVRQSLPILGAAEERHLHPKPQGAAVEDRVPVVAAIVRGGVYVHAEQGLLREQSPPQSLGEILLGLVEPGSWLWLGKPGVLGAYLRREMAGRYQPPSGAQPSGPGLLVGHVTPGQEHEGHLRPQMRLLQ